VRESFSAASAAPLQLHRIVNISDQDVEVQLPRQAEGGPVTSIDNDFHGLLGTTTNRDGGLSSCDSLQFDVTKNISPS
jgi:hypothetical protein